MSKFWKGFFAIIAIPVFLILVWIFAVPGELLKETIENAVARSGNKSLGLSIDGFKKGIFFSIRADSFNLQIDKKPALSITDFSCDFIPGYLIDRELAFIIKGKIGTGNVNGIIKIPVNGNIKIKDAELDAIPYLTQFGLDIKGTVSSDIDIKGNVADIVFKVPDLNIDDTASIIPLLNTFRRLQGSLSLNNGNVKINSITLEGEKGYARLKGDITNGVMALVLELMPVAGKLNTMESMLIGKYMVSPGYYVIPINIK
jgi:type II secretion system protein N